MCAPAAGQECEVREHKNNPQLVSGTIVPMDPHMHGVHPTSSYVSPFPELLGPLPHFGRVNVRQQQFRGVEYVSKPHDLTDQVIP